MDSINFRAKYLDNAFVLAKADKNRFIPKEVTLLKVNMESKSDRKALTDICSEWGKKNNLIELVLFSLNSRPDNKSSIYLLSEQENNFKKLLPEKILGIAEVSDYEQMCSINFLQTNPKYAHSNPKRRIKGVGFALLDYITHKAGKRKTYLDAFNNAVNFYKQFGFKIVKPADVLPMMVYEPKNKGQK